MVSYRDDHDATFARLAAVEREAKRLEEDNQRLTAELSKAQEWLGGARRRFLLATVIAALNVLVFLAGMMVGRITADRGPPAGQPNQAAPKAIPLPQVFGVMVADGPEVGHWTLNATRCATRQDGVELTATGSDGHSVWIADGQIEVELPAGALRIDRKHCWSRFQVQLDQLPTTPPVWSGHVDLDCAFADNRLQGRIEFSTCR